ncbi:hypothetical protein LCGC14_2921540, partial [marine sediment metagenome]
VFEDMDKVNLYIRKARDDDPAVALYMVLRKYAKKDSVVIFRPDFTYGK